MIDETLRHLDQELIAGSAPISTGPRQTAGSEGRLTPTAITMPASLASVTADVDRCIETLEAIVPATALGPIQPLDRELLVNSATALKRIAEASAGALGLLARAGIKPLPPVSPTTPESAS